MILKIFLIALTFILMLVFLALPPVMLFIGVKTDEHEWTIGGMVLGLVVYGIPFCMFLDYLLGF